MWFAPLLRSFHSGSRRPRVGRLQPSKRPTPQRVRLQLEMLEDRRVPSAGLALFDPFGPGLLSDGFHASDFLDNSSASSGFVLPGNGDGSSTNSSAGSGAGTSANVGASSNAGSSAGTQSPAITSPNSAVPNSPFLGTIANHSSPSQSGTGTAPMLAPSSTSGPLFSVTSINSVTTTITSGNDIGYGIGIQADGKIVVSGVANTGPFVNPPGEFTVVRYNPNLTLDTSYGNNGIQTTQITAGMDNEGRGMVLQPSDGKAVVAGWTHVSSKGFGMDNVALARYTTGGVLDTTFGGGQGYVVTDVAGVVNGKPFAGNGTSRAYAVAVDGSGRIIAAGAANKDDRTNDYNLVALERYTSNGTLDTTFNASGKKPGTVTLDLGSDAVASSIAMDANGNYIVAGGTNGNGHFLARFTSAGVLDTTFGASSPIKGTVLSNLFQSDSLNVKTGIALDSSGRIVAVGRGVTTNGGAASLVARFNSDGSLDTTFNGTGSEIIDFGGNGQSFNDVVIQPNGDIVAAGFANSTPGGVPTQYYAIARFNPNGGLDTTFNGTGMLMYNFPGSTYSAGGDVGTAVALNSSGTIVETGWTDAPDPNLTGKLNIGTLAVQP